MAGERGNDVSYGAFLMGCFGEYRGGFLRSIVVGRFGVSGGICVDLLYVLRNEVWNVEKEEVFVLS